MYLHLNKRKGKTKMKTILTLADGAILLQEKGGDFFLSFDGTVGGGNMAGVIEGKGSIKIGTGSVALKAAEQFLNSVLPDAMIPIAEMLEQIINAGVAQL
jgi:hypothetical protein